MPQRTILIVEDCPEDLASMRNIAIASGHRVITAGTLEKATTQLHGAPYDLVVVDLNLPDSKGMSTLAALRSLHKGSFLVVSGHLEGGADDALGVAQIPYINKREGWRDEYSLEMQGLGTKCGLFGARKEQDSDPCDVSWRESVTKMFSALQADVHRQSEKIDQLSTDLRRVTDTVFGHWDTTDPTAFVPGCVAFCRQLRIAGNRVSGWIWGALGTAIGAAVSWAAARIANG